MILRLFSLSLLLFTGWQCATLWQPAPTLAKAPHFPYAWTALAHTRLQQSQPPEQVAAALLRSFETGPYEPQLVLYRLQLLLPLWGHLTPVEQNTVRNQLQISWQERPRHTVQALTSAHAQWLLGDSIGTDPASQARLYLLRKELLSPSPE